MCGIAGIVAPAVARYVEPAHSMVNALLHRGPDSNGVKVFDSCVLGNTRLSIVGLDNGQQPLFSPRLNSAITFNGEIYGYQEIRKHLRAYPFQTKSDTEVILALYERYGRRFIERLPGMFAFALWDDHSKELICARDRFGEKPFYYAFGKEGEFIFASEIKAILASGLIEPVLNLEAVSHYLKHVYVHPTQTIYKNVHPLPPAHRLSLRNGKLKIERYWDFPPVKDEIRLMDAVERFQSLFKRAVQKQIQADVPVGAFLSGGVDSSTVVGVASHSKAALKTFSFGFKSGVESELPYARQIAQLHHTNHFELYDEEADIAELLWRMQEIYDEPFGDSSNIPTYLISKLAREHVKVVLTGDGADELLGGYLFWARSCLQEPTQAPQPPQPPRSHWLAGMIRVLRRFARLEPKPNGVGSAHLAKKYYGFRYYFNGQELRQLGLHLDTEHLIDYTRYTTGTINDVLRMDTDSYLCGDILVKTDRASMANGLELRSPFLDVDFASFCLSLPDRLKVTNETEKLLLREAYQHLWSADVRKRNKQGFGGPMAEWLQLDAVHDLKQSYLCDPKQKIFDILSFDGVQPFVNRNNQQTWSLLVLALWMDRF